MPRPRQKIAVLRITYAQSPGGPVEYVSRKAGELPAEYLRVRSSILDAIRIINTRALKRTRHTVLEVCRFQLANSLSDVQPDAEPRVLADEIARLSYLMHDVLQKLGRLRNSRISYLEELRFKLTYGQTPRKRELAGDRLTEAEEEDVTESGTSAV